MASHSSLTKFILAFAAGFIAVLLFHQGMLALLYAVGFTPRAPFPMQPTKPFGLPVIWSLAFWGGVWGLIFAVFDRVFPRGAGYWIWSFIFGAIGPTLVAWFLVAAVKGQPLGGMERFNRHHRTPHQRRLGIGDRLAPSRIFPRPAVDLLPAS